MARRVLPVYAIVMLFFVTAMPEMASGPMWAETVQPMADACKRWWWTNLLFVGNYVNGGTQEPLVRPSSKRPRRPSCSNPSCSSPVLH